MRYQERDERKSDAVQCSAETWKDGARKACKNVIFLKEVQRKKSKRKRKRREIDK